MEKTKRKFCVAAISTQIYESSRGKLTHPEKKSNHWQKSANWLLPISGKLPLVLQPCLSKEPLYTCLKTANANLTMPRRDLKLIHKSAFACFLFLSILLWQNLISFRGNTFCGMCHAQNIKLKPRHLVSR